MNSLRLCLIKSSVFVHLNIRYSPFDIGYSRHDHPVKNLATEGTEDTEKR